MLKKIRAWLIFKLVGDQPVIMNIDVTLDSGAHLKTLLMKNNVIKISGPIVL